MQYVNDNSDELFRRAGNEYPLDTSSADWSRLAQAMGIQEPPKRRQRRQLLWLLLLLPLPWICLSDTGSRKSAGVAGHTGRSTATASSSTKQVTVPDGASNARSTRQSDPVPTREQTGSFTQRNTVASSHSSLRTRAAGQTKTALTAGRIGMATSGSVRAVDGSPSGLAVTKAQTTRSEEKPATATNASAGTSLSTPDSTVAKTTQPDELKPARSAPVSDRQKARRFYVGVVGGVSVTTIKMQKLSDAGFEAGIIAGYRISNRWSVEGGVISSRRYYYSDGKYLNTGKIYLPPNSSITMVDGQCRMLEIPVSVRFNGAARKRGNWFGTAGLSSYLMQREDYDYAYYYPSSNYTAIHSKTYKNESKDWVSALQLSGGYVLLMKRNLNLRIEPYLQLPLKGMGSGKLPLTSAGLRLGITKSLF
jgi:hypothetical protein